MNLAEENSVLAENLVAVKSTSLNLAPVKSAIELRDADLRRDLATIHIPTLILHGVDDHVCLFDLARAMHDSIKGSQLISIEKAGHGFYYEEKGKVNTELVGFID